MGRASNIRLAGAYRRIAENSHTCGYCGMPADTLDHFTPVSVGAVLTALGIKFKRYLIPACRECNILAGSKLFKTIGQKRHYIKQRLRQRYKKQLNCPNWTQDELEDLGWNLRSMIEKTLTAKTTIKERLRSVPSVGLRSRPNESGRNSARSSVSKRTTQTKQSSQEKLGEQEVLLAKILRELGI